MTRTELMNRAIVMQNELKQRVLEYHTDFEKEKHDTFSITADMTRQYKSMQEELMRKISALEAKIQAQNDQLELARKANEDLRREKDKVIQVKEAQIQELKQKMEDMALEFGEMLKETLDKMSERIDASSTDWEGDNPDHVSKRLAEFNLAV